MKCSNCRAEIVEGMKFCNTCGTPVSKSENCVSSGAESSQKNKFCENCGEKIEDGMKFCSTCGAPISQITVDNSNVTDNYINNQNAEELEEDAMEKSENFIWKCGSYQIEFYEREVPDSDFPDYIGYVDNRYIIIPWYYDRHEFGNFDALRCSVDDDEEYNESYCFKNYVEPYILNGKQISIESVDVQSAPDWEDRFNQLFDEEFYDDDDYEYELKFFEFNLWEEDTSFFSFYGNHYALPIKQMLEGREIDYGYIYKIPEYFEDYYEEEEIEIDEFNDYLRCNDFDSNWVYLLDKDGNRITSVKDFDHSEPDEEGNIYYPVPKTDCIEEDYEYGLTPEAIIKWKEKFFNITFDIIEEDFVMENTKLLHYRGKSSKVIIPDSVTEIGEKAFFGCSSLSSITIPDSVTKIGKSAFCWCESLKEISIPKDCEVDERAFDNGINIIRR